MEGEVKNAIKDNGQEHICDTPEKKGTTVSKNQDAIPILSFLKLVTAFIAKQSTIFILMRTFRTLHNL